MTHKTVINKYKKHDEWNSSIIWQIHQLGKIKHLWQIQQIWQKTVKSNMKIAQNYDDDKRVCNLQIL